jgi:Asp-tRNA(Asn)/Glu-tRNA(Gln) amidotransferase A subunit family amidase
MGTWAGDAIGLVDAFRRGDRSPVEELQATYDSIDSGDLNAVCFTDREAALDTARTADVDRPFGGVPIGVKELDPVVGWPDTHASMPFEDHVSEYTRTNVERIRDRGGAVLAAQTTASEFGGVNVTRTVLHGTTHNPWEHGRTPGGSSGGSAAGVAPVDRSPWRPAATAAVPSAFQRGSVGSSV